MLSMSKLQHRNVPAIALLAMVFVACVPSATPTQIMHTPTELHSSTITETEASPPTVTFTLTPTPTKISATPTPFPEVFLSQLDPILSSVGFGYLTTGVYPVVDGRGIKAGPIYAHGTLYPNGLFAHAPSRLEYGLNGQYAQLRTQISMQEDMSCGDGVIFRVFLDERLGYESDVFEANTPPESITVDTTGVNNLVLIVDKLGGGDCDWAIWGDPVLALADADTLARLAAVTPTPNPDLPCGGVMPERVYLFLDCNDIRRIRHEITSGNAEVRRAWVDLRRVVDDYRAHFPTTYDPEASGGVLWWGPSNYIAREMALIYLVTGEQAYAKDLLRLLELVKLHTPETNHLLNFNQEMKDGFPSSGGLLSHPRYGGVVYQSLLLGYIAVRDTELLNEDQRVLYDGFFVKQARLLNEVVELDEWMIQLPNLHDKNIYWTENFPIATIALAFPNDKSAIDLGEFAQKRIGWQIPLFWESDGGWGRSTDWYGFKALEELIIYVETLKLVT